MFIAGENRFFLVENIAFCQGFRIFTSFLSFAAKHYIYEESSLGQILFADVWRGRRKR